MNDEELEEVIVGVYGKGFQDGQIGMIQTFRDAGLISETMAAIMMHIPTGGTININEHYDKEMEYRVVNDAMKAIRKL